MPVKILAIDSASCLGFAVGMSDGEPRSGFRHLNGEVSDRAGRFSDAIKWFNSMMKEERPDIVCIERPFLNKDQTSMSQLRLSYGFLGIYEGMARMHRCFRVEELDVGAVRSFFAPAPPRPKGDKRAALGSDQKKLLVRKRCLDMGWISETDTNLDQTDALAIWAYAVGKFDPPNSHRFSPLFTQAR